jgi:hypothetical protein
MERVPLIVAHGVGYCNAGEVKERVNRGLSAEDSAQVSIREVFWSELLEPRQGPRPGGFGIGLDAEALSRINRSFLLASVVDFAGIATRDLPRLDRMILAVDRFAFYTATTGLFALPAVVFILLVDLAALLTRGAPIFAFARPFAVEGVVVAATAASCLLAVASGYFVQGRLHKLRGLDGLCVSVRRVGLVGISQAYTVLVIPFISSFVFYPLMFLAAFFAWAVISYVPIWSAFYGYFRLLGWQHAEAAEALPPVSTSLLTWCLYLTAIAVLAFAASKVAEGTTTVIKILADVAHYLGDADHHAELQSRLASALEAASWKDGPAIFCGHSLGSMILIDYLRAEEKWGPLPGRVALITMGSPSLRLFHRFFPRQYPSPAELAVRFREMIPGFAWFNIYRPLDPIGGRLLLPARPWFRDISTKQWMLRKILKGNPIAPHVGYFEDPVVHANCQEIAEILTRGGEPEAGPPDGGRAGLTEPLGPSERKHARRLVAPLHYSARLASLGFFLVVAYWLFVAIPGNHHAALRRDCAAITSHGGRVNGVVRASKTSSLSVPGTNLAVGTPNYFCKAMYRPECEDGDRKAIGVLTDHKSLFRWAEKRGTVVHRDPLFSRAFERGGLLVIYDRDHPERCFFPDFMESAPTLWGELKFWRVVFLLIIAGLIISLHEIQVGVFRGYPPHSPNSRKGGLK